MSTTQTAPAMQIPLADIVGMSVDATTAAGRPVIAEVDGWITRIPSGAVMLRDAKGHCDIPVANVTGVWKRNPDTGGYRCIPAQVIA